MFLHQFTFALVGVGHGVKEELWRAEVLTRFISRSGDTRVGLRATSEQQHSDKRERIPHPLTEETEDTLIHLSPNRR
jgi:hypothetical protein